MYYEYQFKNQHRRIAAFVSVLVAAGGMVNQLGLL